jgi:hypothetical protein
MTQGAERLPRLGLCRAELRSGRPRTARGGVRDPVRARVGESGAESVQAEVLIVVVPVPLWRGGWRARRCLASWSPWRPPGLPGWVARCWPASGWRSARRALRDGCSAMW